VEGYLRLLSNDPVQAAQRHIEAHWAFERFEDVTWDEPHVPPLIRPFRVRKILPVRAGDPWTYVSLGASRVSSDGNYRCEFFLQAREPNEMHVETVTMLATYHSRPSQFLDAGSAVRIGRPWVGASRCDAIYVSRPYGMGNLEWCHSEEFHIRLLWLIPITDQELQMLVVDGAEALETAFESSAIDVLDPHRLDAGTTRQ
jgi:hypothetical protein